MARAPKWMLPTKRKEKIEVFLGGVWQWTSDGDNGLDDERCVKNYESKNNYKLK